MCVPSSTTQLPQRSEPGAHVGDQKLRLFKRREVSTFVLLVVIDQFGIRPLRPTARAQIDLVREGAYGNRDGNAFDTEIREFAFPVQAGSGNPRVQRPGDRYVVENNVPPEALGVFLKNA